MTKKAKKLSVYISLVAMPFGAATVRLASRATPLREISAVDATQETDAAYRDGIYLGKLDGQEGRNVRPSIGRWNSAKDRASFAVGYQKGYREAQATSIAEHR